MIDPRLQAFLAHPLMVVAAARDSRNRPALARAMGVRACGEGGSIELFISRSQWRGVVEALAPGVWMAVTVCRPENYETYQVKGRVESCTVPDAQGLDFAAAYCRRITEHLLSLGPTRRQIACWITTEDLVSVRLRTERLFNQTPGPGAGNLLPQGVR